MKDNALAELFNLLVASKKRVDTELERVYNTDDPIFRVVADIVAAGEIPSA